MQKKNILITGASSGIGKALAMQYANDNNTLILVARDEVLLNEVKTICELQGAMVHVFKTDLSNSDNISLLVQSLSTKITHLDILINNAGISQRSHASETAETVDRFIMELNFFTPVKITKLVWPLLIKSPHANIVNISSVTGTFGFPQRSAYAASKHAMEGFFESWMLENKEPNIFFTLVAPGRILTNISMNALKNDGTKHNVLDEGQARGIEASECASQIIKAIQKNKRKVFIVQQERILLILYRFFPLVFVYLVKKLDLK